MENLFIILANFMNNMKNQKLGHRKLNSPSWLTAYMLLEITIKEKMEPKGKQHLIVDITMDTSKI